MPIKTVLPILYFIANIAFANDVLFNLNHAVPSSSETQRLLSFIGKVPTFLKEIDPNLEISFPKNCNQEAMFQTKINFKNGGDLAEGLNGCLGYKMMEELVNKSSEASLTRKDYKARLGFNLLDSLIKFVKNNEFEKAYHYLQIYYDKDVLYKTDGNGNSVFHILAQKCADPKAQDFLIKLVIHPKYHNSKFITPLKIKTTEDEQNKLNTKCQNLSLDQVSKKYLAGDFFSLANDKGENVFDVMGPECKGTVISEILFPLFDEHLEEYLGRKDFSIETLHKLFPDTYKDKIAKMMLNLPTEKTKEFLKNYDFKDFDFVKEFGASLAKPAEEMNAKNREYIIEKFTLNSIQMAQTGTLDDSTVALLVQNGNFIQKDQNGDSLLDSVRKNDNSVRYMKELQGALRTPVLTAIANSKIDDPYLVEFMKNGDPKTDIGISIPFFTYVSYNKNEEFKKKIYDYYKVSVEDDDPFLTQLNVSLAITKEITNENELSAMVHDLCSVVGKLNGQISCEKFEKTMIDNIHKYGMNIGFVTPVLNLIDQASLYGQNTVAYLLNSLINRVNPDAANLIAAKRNFVANIDPALFEKMAPFILDKIIKGEIEYNPERYKFKEFIGKAFKSSIEENSSIGGIGYLYPAPIDSAKLYGINEKGEPLFIKDADNAAHNSLQLKSIPGKIREKIVEYVHCDSVASCGSTLYKLADITMAGPAEAVMKGVKEVTSDNDFRSIITASSLTACRATCGALLVSDLALGSVTETMTIISIDGVATKVAKVVKLSSALIRTTNTYEALEGFLVETQEDVIRARECGTNCIVQDTFKRVEEKEKLVLSKRDAREFLDTKIDNMVALQKSIDSIRALANKYGSDPRMQTLLSSFERDKVNFISTFKQYASKFNESTKLITTTKDVKVIEHEKMNIALAETMWVKTLTSLGNDYSIRIKQLSSTIRAESRGDPSGAGGHGRIPGGPSTPETPNTPTAPEAGGNSNAGNSGNNSGGTGSGGGNVSIPTW